MAERSGSGLAQALVDGIRRTASAPAVLAGTVLLTFVFALPADLTTGAVLASYRQVMDTTWIHGFGAVPLLPWLDAPGARPAFGPWSSALRWMLFWAFFSGGIFDRLARQRPTRGRGFFGACGAHFPAMLRLGVCAAVLSVLLSRALAPGVLASASARAGVMLGLLTVNLMAMYARVRIVVEDRRSAVGAIWGAGRFVRRNLAAAGVHLIYSLLAALVLLLAASLARADARGPILTTIIETFLVLASCASATALFQSRLAHASYTAAPAIDWPESPAAEAMSNVLRIGQP